MFANLRHAIARAIAPKAPPPIARGFDLSAIDKSADACTDFYQYACGNWTKDNPTPSDQVHWIRSFSLLQERYLYELRQELTRAAAKPASPLEKKYGDFYGACMDIEELQKKGLEPLKPALERIAALSDTKGIAAWFIDTAYNEESFFVRHAYFLGANDPYKSLKAALRAEIDEDAWASLYRAESRPFARPSTGKIAVKVINHLGDEVMKVFRVS